MSLNDSELKVLEVLWEHGNLTASQIYKILAEKVGWSRNTSYTIIKRCVEKGLIIRTEPNFVCTANITKREAQKEGISDLIHRFFDNSTSAFMSAFVEDGSLSDEDIGELKDLINKLK